MLYFSTLKQSSLSLTYLKKWIEDALPKWTIFYKILKENLNEDIKNKINQTIIKRYKNLKNDPKSMIDSILKYSKKRIITDQLVNTNPTTDEIIIERNSQ